MRCIFCGDTGCASLGTVGKDDLISLYGKGFSTDVSEYFDSDLTLYECVACRLKFFDPLVTGDEKFYNALQKYDWYYADNKHEYEIAREYVGEGDQVLDVGSGRGAFARHVPHAKFLGLDFSENARAIAEREGVEVRCQSVEEYAAQNPESVDVVTAFQVMEHVADPRRFTESLLETLKPGGRMVVAVPSESSFWGRVTNNVLNMPPHHGTRWSDECFRFMSNEFELDLLRIYHEKVQDVHVPIYLGTLIEGSLMRPRLIDRRLSRRVIARLSQLLAGFLARGFDPQMRPDGHTVMAVFQKK